jgi:hypothetical protein
VIGSGYLRGPGETALYLFTCGGPESAIGGDVFKGSDVNDFIHLAYYVLDTSKTLDLAGYPRSVWKTTLDQYEIEQVRIITCGRRSTVGRDFDQDSQFLKHFAVLLNEYRAKAGKSSLRKPFTGSPGCGDGEVTVYIKVEPKATRIQYNFD